MTLRQGTTIFGTLLAGAGVFSFIAGGVIWIYTFVEGKVVPLEAKTNINTVEITTIKNDVLWIRGALENQGFSPKNVRK